MSELLRTMIPPSWMPWSCNNFRLSSCSALARVTGTPLFSRDRTLTLLPRLRKPARALLILLIGPSRSFWLRRTLLVYLKSSLLRRLLFHARGGRVPLRTFDLRLALADRPRFFRHNLLLHRLSTPRTISRVAETYPLLMQLPIPLLDLLQPIFALAAASCSKFDVDLAAFDVGLVQLQTLLQRVPVRELHKCEPLGFRGGS